MGEIKDVETPTCDYAKAHNFLCYKFTSPGTKGVPDRMFIKDGFLFFAEFKDAGKKLDKLQKHHKKQIGDNGFQVWVIDSKDKGFAMIDHYIRVIDLMRTHI